MAAHRSEVAQAALLLPADTTADDVEALALSRFAGAAWRRREGTDGGVGVLRLGHGIEVVGPCAAEDAAAAGWPSVPLGPLALAEAPGATSNLPAVAYLLRSPRSRGAPPGRWMTDRDGLTRAFRSGLPTGPEELAVRWAVAVARRLQGALVVGDQGTVLRPDPEAAPALTVYAAVGLAPAYALAAVRSVLPWARLDAPEAGWDGPPPGTGEVPVPGAEGLDAGLRRWLHAEADAYDAAHLSAGRPALGYAVLADLDHDGTLVVEALVEEVVPTAVAALPWPQSGAYAYRVTWAAPDEAETTREFPGAEHLAARSRVLPLLGEVAAVVQAAVGGQVLDEDEFLVDPADL